MHPRSSFNHGRFGCAGYGGDEGGVFVQDVDDPFCWVPVARYVSSAARRGRKGHTLDEDHYESLFYLVSRGQQGWGDGLRESMMETKSQQCPAHIWKKGRLTCDYPLQK